MANGVYMSEERVRASIPGITAQVIPDEDLSNLERNTPIRERVRPRSMDFPGMVTKPAQRGHAGAPDGDYMRLAALDSIGAYPESLTKERQTKMVLTLLYFTPGHCQIGEGQVRQSWWIEHRK